MKLFKLENFVVNVSEEAFTLLPFKKLLKRDKSRNKETAFKEMAFLYHYADIKSDFLIIPEDERTQAIIQRIGLPENWKIDADIQEAIDLYKERTVTPTMKLYQDTLNAALALANYLSDAKTLLEERTDKGGLVTTPATLTSAINGVNRLITDLLTLEKTVIREQQDTNARTKGARTLSMFEDGHGIIEFKNNEDGE